MNFKGENIIQEAELTAEPINKKAPKVRSRPSKGTIILKQKIERAKKTANNKAVIKERAKKVSKIVRHIHPIEENDEIIVLTPEPKSQKIENSIPEVKEVPKVSRPKRKYTPRKRVAEVSKITVPIESTHDSVYEMPVDVSPAPPISEMIITQSESKLKETEPIRDLTNAPEVPIVLPLEVPKEPEHPHIETTSLIPAEEQADFNAEITIAPLQSLAEIKEFFKVNPPQSEDDITNMLFAHSLKLQDINAELRRVQEKETEYKRHAETIFTQNNHIENDDSYNLRQHARHYGELAQKLDTMRQDEVTIQFYLETKISEFKKNKEFPHNDLSDAGVHQHEVTPLTEPSSSIASKLSLKDRLIKIGRGIFKFSKPKPSHAIKEDTKEDTDENRKAA